MQQLHLSHPLLNYYYKPLKSPKVIRTIHFDFLSHRTHLQTTLPLIHKATPSPIFTSHSPKLLPLITTFSSANAIASTTPSPPQDDDAGIKIHDHDGASDGKSFWGAVSLIIGTAVGPGMLGLPALTIKAGPFPSTIIILLSWLYVISSILLVAELSFAAMQEDGVEEVSFTGLATKALGNHFGAFVALVYTSLSFSLLVACVAGIGSIFSPLFPKANAMIVHALFPLLVGMLIVFFPFNTIDVANRLLCFLMLFSITALVAVGLSIARVNIISSFGLASWSVSSIPPIIPSAVLTLGFHVITPFICKIAGNTVHDAKRAILIGGTVPLMMVLSWNLIVLGLVGTNKAAAAASSRDPISLLLSVNPSALSAVQGFAFSAMATSLIGYAVSFPKQLLDTLELVSGKDAACNEEDSGRVGFAFYSGGSGYSGKICFGGRKDLNVIGPKVRSKKQTFESFKVIATVLVLGFSVLIASFFRSTFSRALDFAGVYANCFLFGIIPPVMAYIHQSKKKTRSSIIPGGNGTLLLLFVISVILAIWH